MLDPKRFLRQTATVWSTTPNGYGGSTFGTPYTISCRWEDRSMIFQGRVAGKEEVSRSIIYTDRDLLVGDWIALGDQTGQSDPSGLDIAFPIRDFQSSPDLRNMIRVRKAVI